MTTYKSQHPTRTVENGKALIYLVQENPGSTRIGADGKRLGGLQRGGYFSASIDQGERHPCALAHIGLWNHVSLYELNVKADDRILCVFPAYCRQAKGADFDFTPLPFFISLLHFKL